MVAVYHEIVICQFHIITEFEEVELAGAKCPSFFGSKGAERWYLSTERIESLIREWDSDGKRDSFSSKGSFETSGG